MDFKKVRINNVKKNMILAKDVITKSGMIIFVKGSALSDRDIEKLEKSDIEYIYVYEQIDANPFDVNDEYDFEEEVKKSVVNRKEFKKFVDTYRKRVDKIKDSFLGILNGEPLNTSNLYESATSILDDVRCKSDVVNYIYHLKAFDNYTYRHSINVSILCYLYAEWTNMPYNEKRDITIAGILHDIGKTMIDDKILNKNGKLTKEEFYEMKKHTSYGYMLLIDQDLHDTIKLTALMHHEKLDGTGYPLGITESKIERFAKIVSVCDIYDAMTSDRAYHIRKCPFEVLKEFEENYYGSLDVEKVMIFSRNIAYSYVGSRVLLSNEEEGEVVFINQNNISKPIVKIGEKFIDLCTSSGLYIQSLI